MEKKINFLGVKVDNVSMDEVVQRILEYSSTNGKKVITYINANCFNISRGDQEYKSLLNLADMILPDGYGIIFAAKILQTPLTQRVNNADFFERFCKAAEEKKISIYLLGAEATIIGSTVYNLKNRFLNLNIVGSHNGYFNQDQESEIIEEINRVRPDILIVSLGVPKQEKWIYRNLDKLNVRVFWAVGGLFNLLSGELKRAPRWVIQSGFEWLYRLCQEPNRLWKRYTVGNAIFIWQVLLHRLFKKTEFY